MIQVIEKPCSSNRYLAEHAALLISSYHHWTGKDLVQQKRTEEQMYRALFEAPYAVVSHNTEVDPIFNYANQTALRLFAMEWSAFTRLPSRKSAERVNRSARERLMQRVTREGFIDDYQGVRISSSGKRFMIKDATVWNIIDNSGLFQGQAAVFYNWTEL